MMTLQFAARASFIVGLDRSVDLVNLAHKRGALNVAWVIGDMEYPPFTAACFDLVVSTNAIR
jgi:ubiquinone/menaquinone biosynthesis C-methylase UbiE